MYLFKKKDNELNQRLTEIKKQNKNYKKRIKYIDKRMNDIYRENKVIPSMKYIFSLIPKYVINPDKSEIEYCERKLRELYSKGFNRYDDERIR
jgi:predicted RNase H-like nuclease (RuvC/YqgF family)